MRFQPNAICSKRGRNAIKQVALAMASTDRPRILHLGQLNADERRALTARGAIEGGESVSEPLRGTRVFPLMVTQMINIGETTGALDTMLGKIAEFYEEEVDASVSSMLTLLEPMMIAFLGVVVATIVRVLIGGLIFWIALAGVILYIRRRLLRRAAGTTGND